MNNTFGITSQNYNGLIFINKGNIIQRRKHDS